MGQLPILELCGIMETEISTLVLCSPVLNFYHTIGGHYDIHFVSVCVQLKTLVWAANRKMAPPYGAVQQLHFTS